MRKLSYSQKEEVICLRLHRQSSSRAHPHSHSAVTVFLNFRYGMKAKW